jgi:hypothetical protein
MHIPDVLRNAIEGCLACLGRRGELPGAKSLGLSSESSNQPPHSISPANHTIPGLCRGYGQPCQPTGYGYLHWRGRRVGGSSTLKPWINPWRHLMSHAWDASDQRCESSQHDRENETDVYSNDSVTKAAAKPCVVSSVSTRS